MLEHNNLPKLKFVMFYILISMQSVLLALWCYSFSPYCICDISWFESLKCINKPSTSRHQRNTWHRSSGVRRKFSWGGFIQWHMVVICIRGALFVPSQYDVVFMFPNQRFGEGCWHHRHIFLHALPRMCHCTEYKLSALQVRISKENILDAKTEQFIIAKISGRAFKQGSKTHSSLRRSNLQLQNQAALMTCRIRAVEYRKCAAELAGSHPGLQDRIMLISTRLRMRMKYARKLSIFCYV